MEVADTIGKRTLGLMFRKNGEMFFSFPFDVRFSVWTPFMRFPIDIFFIDDNGEVVDKNIEMVPWRFYRPKKSYRYFFEAMAGRYESLPEKVVNYINKKL